MEYVSSVEFRNGILRKQREGVIYMAKKFGISIFILVILCNIAILASSNSRAEEPPNWGIYTYYGCDGNWAIYHCEFPQLDGGCWPITNWHRQPCGCC